MSQLTDQARQKIRWMKDTLAAFSEVDAILDASDRAEANLAESAVKAKEAGDYLASLEQKKTALASETSQIEADVQAVRDKAAADKAAILKEVTDAQHGLDQAKADLAAFEAEADAKKQAVQAEIDGEEKKLVDLKSAQDALLAKFGHA
jgi:hypothetical protein